MQRCTHPKGANLKQSEVTIRLLDYKYSFCSQRNFAARKEWTYLTITHPQPLRPVLFVLPLALNESHIGKAALIFVWNPSRHLCSSSRNFPSDPIIRQNDPDSSDVVPVVCKLQQTRVLECANEQRLWKDERFRNAMELLWKQREHPNPMEEATHHRFFGGCGPLLQCSLCRIMAWV